MIKKPLVSIIIVNWNGKAVLPDCLNSLAKIDYPNYEVIMVDNGSTDESLAFVDKNIAVVRNKTNVGFAKANNQGVKIAKGKYILLLNNDTKVTAKFLTTMVDRMEKDLKIGAMQPKIFLMDYKKLLDNAGSFLNTIGFSEHWGYGEKDSNEFDQEREIFAAKGACLLTRHKLVDEIGLFDSDFHSYYEESDFCWRVWMAGLKVIYYPKAYIYHKVGFTSKRMSQIDINYYSLRNRMAAMFKNFEALNLLKYLVPHLFLLSGLGFYYLIRLQLSKAYMVFKAIAWALWKLPELSAKRREVQTKRVKRDKEILPIIMHKTDWGHLFSHFQKVEQNFK